MRVFSNGILTPVGHEHSLSTTSVLPQPALHFLRQCFDLWKHGTKYLLHCTVLASGTFVYAAVHTLRANVVDGGYIQQNRVEQ